MDSGVTFMLAMLDELSRRDWLDDAQEETVKQQTASNTSKGENFTTWPIYFVTPVWIA